MKVTAIQPVDDCIDTSLTREIQFDAPMTTDTIELLANFGELQFHRSFARPLFHLLIENRIHVKGIEGNDHCLVILDQSDIDGSLNRVRELFEAIAALTPESGTGQVPTA